MTPCEDIIRQTILSTGPITVEEFMDIALHHPEHGYYSQAHAIGANGDFITAPEVSQLFGEIIGAWIVDTWQKLGSPSLFNLIELGPGRGTLMADALRVGKQVDGFMEACRLFLVEQNETLKAKQTEVLSKYSPQWSNTFPSNSLKKAPVIVIANEFFDAFPIKQFSCKENQWFETHVALTDDQLDFQDIQTDQEPNYHECSPQAEAYFRSICERVKENQGALLIIDYGYDEPLEKHTLQALRNHEYSAPLREIGRTDLTSHVNFATLKDIATDNGLAASSITTQGRFLSVLGILERSQQLQSQNPLQIPQIMSGMLRLIQPEQMGTLFKVLCVSSPKTLKPEGFQ